jgi:chemotaxis response regulator CheB
MPKLPGDLPVPVFIVQHMPPLFLNENSATNSVCSKDGRRSIDVFSK